MKNPILQRHNLDSMAVALFTMIGGIFSVGKYGFMDDYKILWQRESGHFDWSLYLSQGRPLVALFEWLQFGLIGDINSLWIFHALAVIFLGFLAREIYIYLNNYDERRPIRLLVSVGGILLTPGLMLTTAWGVLALVPLFMLAVIRACRILENPKSSRISKFAANLTIPLASLTYQPLVGIVLILPIIGYVLAIVSGKRNAGSALLQIYKDRFKVILFTGIFTLTYLDITAQLFPNQQRVKLLGPIGAKIKFIWHDALPTMFRIGSPSNHVTQLFIIALILTIWLCIVCARISNNFIYLLIIPLGICISLTPSALTAENWASTRSLFEGEWFVSCVSLIAFGLLVQKIFGNQDDTFQKLTFGFLLSGIIIHSNYLMYFEMAKPQQTELRLAKQAILRLDVTQPIYTITSVWSESLANWVYADEFGLPSSCQPWVPIPMSQLLLNSLHGTRSKTYQVLMTTNLQTNATNEISYYKILLH